MKTVFESLKTLIGAVYWLALAFAVGRVMSVLVPELLIKISPKTSSGVLVFGLVAVFMALSIAVPLIIAKIADIAGIWYTKSNKINIFLRLLLALTCGFLTGRAVIVIGSLWLNGRYLGAFDGFLLTLCSVILGLCFTAVVASDSYPGTR